MLIADTADTGSGWWPARTGTFYGQPMTAGDIYTIAGNGAVGVLRRRRAGHQRRSWAVPPAAWPSTRRATW